MSLLVRQSEALWGEMFLREKNLPNNKNAKKLLLAVAGSPGGPKGPSNINNNFIKKINNFIFSSNKIDKSLLKNSKNINSIIKYLA